MSKNWLELPAGADIESPGFVGLGPDGKAYPFAAANDAPAFPPGWVTAGESEHVELPDGTHEVRYRFVVNGAGPPDEPRIVERGVS